jgi:hypothetical protein
MARWLDKPLFTKVVQPTSEGAPFAFSVNASAGQGHLRLWALRPAPGTGGTFTVLKVALEPDARHALEISGDGDTRLKASLTEKRASPNRTCCLTPACSGLATLAADARR